MKIKENAKAQRDNLQQGIYYIINPFVRLLIKCGITPNMVTTIGLSGNIAAAVLMIIAGYRAGQTGVVPYSYVTIAGCVAIAFSVFDMLDGQVARLGGMESRFGAMYDSVLDRYCELFILGGVAYYFIQFDHLGWAIITYLAMVGSLLVSYIRARGQGLGVDCKMGFMQRPERVVVTFTGILATGILGQCGLEWADIVLGVCMTIIAIFANMTAFARLSYCKRELGKRRQETGDRGQETGDRRQGTGDRGQGTEINYNYMQSTI